MTAIAMRNSALGVVIETTQNTLLAPQSSGDYMPLQGDFAIAPNYGQIENLEIRASIGRAASIQGAEEPTSNLSFYFKAGGTEGTAPHWGDIAKSFFGDVVAEATQRVIATAAANVDIFTVEALASTTAGDHGIFYDTVGNSWAWSANKTGADVEPTDPLWIAVAAARKSHVDVSSATTATDVATLLRTALNLLSGFSALFTTSGSSTLIVTSDAIGYVHAGAVYAAAGGVPTGLTYTQSVVGHTATTASLLQVPSAATYLQAGYGMLIKDPINGYRLRVVHSVSVEAVTPSFDVPVAPAAGVGLGKTVFYKPMNSAHPSLSLWWYGGNGGATQAASGALVNEFGYSSTANEAILGKASFEALAFYFDPIEITASTKYLDWTDDTGTFAAAVTVKSYKDPHELAEALTTAMNAANPLLTHTVTYVDSNGKFKFVCTGTVLTLKFASGSNTANTIATKIGFAVVDESGTAAGTGYSSDTAQSFAAPHTPAYDTTQPYVAKNQEVMVGEQGDYVCFSASATSMSGKNIRSVVQDICAESGRSSAIINGREVEITVKAMLNKYDALQMSRFRKGSTIRFQQTMGPKEGGQWIPGNVAWCYAPYCKISSISIVDDEGLATLDMTLQPFVPDDGSGEIYVGCN